MDDTRGSKQAMDSRLLCPRCVSQMLSVQRFGVMIDQCSGCGGIFLDLGEIARLTAAEGRFYGAQSPLPQQPRAYSAQHYPAQPAYVEAPRPAGFLGALFSGESCYGGGHGGHP